MGVSVKVTQFVLRTTNGITDITVSGAGTCKGVVFIMGGAETNGTVRNTKHHGIGWVDTAGVEKVGIAGNAQDAVGTTQTTKSWSDTYCIAVHNNNGTAIDGQYNWDSYITDGVRITTSNPSARAFLCTAILFYGSDVTTVTGSLFPEGTVDVENTVDIGQDSDLLFWSNTESSVAADTIEIHTSLMLAISTWDGATIRQRMIRVHSQDARNSASIKQMAGPRVSMNFAGGTQINRGMECTTMDTDLVGITSREGGSPTDRPYHFLSVNFNGIAEARVEALTVPTSGDLSSTAYGFTPQFMLFGFINVSAQVDESGSFTNANDDFSCIGAMDESSEFSQGYSDEDEAGTSNAASVANSSVLYGTDEADNVEFDGDFGSFDSTGFTITMNTNPAAVLSGWGLAIEGEAAPELVEIVDDAVQIVEDTEQHRAISQLADEAVQVVEDTEAHLTMTRLVDEIIEVIEATESHRTMTRSADDIVQIVEGTEQHRVIVQLSDDLIQIVETAEQHLAMTRLVDDVVQIVETTIRPRVMARPVDETVQILEVVEQHRAITHLVDEVVQVVETTEQHRVITQLVDDVVQILEAAEQHRAIVQRLDDVIQIVETTVRPRVMIRLIDEVEQVVETTVRPRVMSRRVDNTVQIVEGTEQHRAIVQLADEVIHVVETTVNVLDAATAALVEIIDEVIQIPETVEQHREITQITDEVVQIVEAILRPRVMVRQVDEVVNLVEAIEQHRDIVQLISEQEQIPETAEQHRAIVQIADEAVQIIEATNTALALVRAINEVVEISDQALRSMVLTRVLSEVVQIPDGVLTARAMTRIVNEVIQIIEGTVKRIFVGGVGDGPLINVDVLLPDLNADLLLADLNADLLLLDLNVDVTLPATDLTVAI